MGFHSDRMVASGRMKCGPWRARPKDSTYTLLLYYRISPLLLVRSKVGSRSYSSGAKSGPAPTRRRACESPISRAARRRCVRPLQMRTLGNDIMALACPATLPYDFACLHMPDYAVSLSRGMPHFAVSHIKCTSKWYAKHASVDRGISTTRKATG